MNFEDFESELKGIPSSTLANLIESEGLKSALDFIAKPCAEAGLVESDLNPEPLPDNSISRGDGFRIEVPSEHSAGYVFALQNANHRWAILPGLADIQNSCLLVPGLKRNGDFGYLYEHEQLGPHLFVVFQTPRKVPDALMRYFHERTELDMAGLKAVISFYSNQPKDRRVMYSGILEVRDTANHVE